MGNSINTLDDTGERMVPEYHKSRLFYGEHIIRYKSAQSLVRGKTVLDIASGTGYGSAMLAVTAKKVYGVDSNQSTIEYASKKYKKINTEYILGDATKIPIGNNSVDAVVSFETIEHLKDYNQFLTEIKRVLKPGGLLILSTPNNEEYPDSNPYHLHEFDQRELNWVLKKHFKNVKDYYQATWLYSAILDAKKLGTDWEQSIPTVQAASLQKNRSVYFFSLCSDNLIKEDVQPIGVLSEYSNIRLELEKQKKIEKLRTRVNRIEQEKQGLQVENKALEQALENIRNSKLWKLGLPMRASSKIIKRYVRKP